MSDTRVRIGLIGLGNNMLSHIGRLVQMPEVELVGGCDPVTDMHARARDRFPQLASMPTFATHEELLRGVAPDAVIISTPHSYHRDQTVASLEAGAHVLVEKPLVNSVREANDVIRARDASGKVVMVSYQRHTQAPYLKIKEIIEKFPGFEDALSKIIK
jgi:predicted dehydrogenase